MNTPVKPITPAQAAKSREDTIPNFVIKAFNKLIQSNLDGTGEAKITLKEARAAIRAASESAAWPCGRPIKDAWLDVEPVFRKAGWSVVCDRPAYNESYEAFFVFSAKEGMR